jgi:hypothetical protein
VKLLEPNLQLRDVLQGRGQQEILAPKLLGVYFEFATQVIFLTQRSLPPVKV